MSELVRAETAQTVELSRASRSTISTKSTTVSSSGSQDNAPDNEGEASPKRPRLSIMPPFAMREHPPQLLEKYEVLEVLGRGSFGEVRRARRRSDGLEVAVKLMKGNGSKAKQVEQFDHEIQVLREICTLAHHPHLIHMMECFHDPVSGIGVVLELGTGGDLLDHVISVVDTGGCFSEATVAGWIRQVALALKALHEVGIVHRDVKPENLLFKTPERQILALSDYGLSLIGKTTTKRRTGEKHELVGTYAYMAPEILEREEYTEACDVWGLGCVLHILLTGEFLVEGCANREEQLSALHEALPVEFEEDRASMWAAVSPGARQCLSMCLDRSPSRRATVDGVLACPWVAPGGAPGGEAPPSLRVKAAFEKLHAHRIRSKIRGATRLVMLSLSAFGLRHKALSEAEVCKMRLKKAHDELIAKNKTGLVPMKTIEHALTASGVGSPNRVRRILDRAVEHHDHHNDHNDIHDEMHRRRLSKSRSFPVTPTPCSSDNRVLRVAPIVTALALSIENPTFEDRQRALRIAFDAWDVLHGTSTLTIAEISSLIVASANAHHCASAAPALTELFGSVLQDHDGHIDFKAFSEFVETSPPLRALLFAPIVESSMEEPTSPITEEEGGEDDDDALLLLPDTSTPKSSNDDVCTTRVLS